MSARRVYVSLLFPNQMKEFKNRNDIERKNVLNVVLLCNEESTKVNCVGWYPQ